MPEQLEKYSVLFALPDYLCDQIETIYEKAEGRNMSDAVQNALDAAIEQFEPDSILDRDDLMVLLVLPGHIDPVL